MNSLQKSKVKNPELAPQGRLKIEWAESRMPVLMKLREEAKRTQPLKGMRIAGCLHVTKETAVLVRTLKAAGAEVAWSGCNPLSTQDDIAAALADEVSIYAWHGMNKDEFYWAIERTLDLKPTLTLDDGADLIFTVHSKHQELAKGIIGGTEETTTGVHRLRAMAKDGALKYPVIAINDAETKWDFDNVYGTGQSSIDGIIRATNVLLGGKVFVVAGYGHCGRGCAMRAKGMGARVVVTEIKPTAALKAVLEGFEVMKMDEAAKIGDIFITATGMKDIIVDRHFNSMKEGAIVSNTGHYDCEINLDQLKGLSKNVREVRPNNEEFTLKNGKKIYVLAQGRLVNLAAAEGHPSEVMDMSFANQFLGMVRLAKEGKNMKPMVYDIDPRQDQEIALVKLHSLGMQLDALTPEQAKYADDYSAGT
ncbi:MAG: adenosylhomocysteinase [Bdellovibrionales bacterium RIFOXYC1_FULL_54_43]|nr:MAG: adenosylhomocysteinase [Bdellovibrionales bacterium RIFOXYC1_FULL_54_43]OFZ78339.1 MAG: adenosylhomocysteinase [Bdellovibrionales bacterium RIFOXYD1_FULL_55_31]